MTGANEVRAARGWPLAAERGTLSAEVEGFRREVAFEPGHAWTTKGAPPSEDYGRASLTVRFLLHGPKGSTQFLWSTGITPEPVVTRMSWGAHEEWMHSAPTGFDVGYHADEPQYGEHESYECPYRPSGRCFYDGSGLAGDRLLKVFLTQGEDAMWAFLRRRYDEQFEVRS